ncbi:MAG TPA: helix-turn-helix transcriptional regulator [Thermoanaerobaculia bacterium]|nr:helix-turn-helix transcriptional regulator [Thermoanaerobaculia bacterium]
MRAVLSVLDRDYSGVPDYAGIASQLGVCLTRLEHLFKRDTGKSMRDHLRDRRLEAAAAMLVETNQRVSEIAWAVGYKDVANFNHAFRHMFGVSPSEYRIDRRIEQLLPSAPRSDQA